ncbi:FHA domain-containing protein, partial [Planctomycetota bacterium]
MSAAISFHLPEQVVLGPFRLDRPVVTGRGREADLVIPHLGISRRHCLIQPAEYGAEVEDLGSSNGIVFQGETVTRARVAAGEEFRMGQT